MMRHRHTVKATAESIQDMRDIQKRSDLQELFIKDSNDTFILAHVFSTNNLYLNKAITKLRLCSVKIEVWMKALTSDERGVLLTHPTIYSIDLSGSVVSEKALAAIIKLINVSQKITEINLTNCKINDAFASKLLVALENNHLITTLSLNQNTISEDLLNRIQKILKRNSKNVMNHDAQLRRMTMLAGHFFPAPLENQASEAPLYLVEQFKKEDGALGFKMTYQNKTITSTEIQQIKVKVNVGYKIVVFDNCVIEDAEGLLDLTSKHPELQIVRTNHRAEMMSVVNSDSGSSEKQAEEYETIYHEIKEEQRNDEEACRALLGSLSVTEPVFSQEMISNPSSQSSSSSSQSRREDTETRLQLLRETQTAFSVRPK